MHFSTTLEDDEEYNIIECTKLDNNILIYKNKIDENVHHILKLKENQYAILFKQGKIYDSVKEEGVYTIRMEPNNTYPDDFNDYIIKENNDSLCIIFFNMDVITKNKFYIKKKHKNNFYGEGTFDFKIESPVNLLNKVIEVRSYYSREELLEQIREKISKIVTSVIKNSENEYILEENLKSNLNIFADYGIKIVSSDIKDIQFKKKM